MHGPKICIEQGTAAVAPGTEGPISQKESENG